eukprot:CAMPEP_0173184762 /NCGR_PEP_ID=MMETSP1141-20130122/9154_1 /TAXON_ID=483371 /ORGANISM="non described non described, Strain CCMP2298" /LENGTH=108 /DNA_ID=CAMNT_0014108165 /DNA_START=419 /DNA_END=745 /DNA_ORIENTATION=+
MAATYSACVTSCISPFLSPQRMCTVIKSSGMAPPKMGTISASTSLTSLLLTLLNRYSTAALRHSCRDASSEIREGQLLKSLFALMMSPGYALLGGNGTESGQYLCLLK